MKSAGLNQNYRRMHKQTTKISAAESFQGNHLAAKEKQKSLRLQAAQAQFERQKREKLGVETLPLGESALPVNGFSESI
jgi:hypothetical protein